MRFLLLLAAAFFSFQYASAYAMAGAYERLLYYHAYIIDYSKTGTATKIAVGCIKVMKTKGVPCTFNQFIEYINDDPEAKDFSITTDKEPDLDSTARKLLDKGLTKQYDGRKILQSADRVGITGLLAGVGDWLGFAAPRASPEIQNKMRDLALAVLRERISATAEKMQKDLLAKGVQMVRRTVPAYDGSTLQVEVINRPGTLAGTDKPAKEVNAIIKKVMDAGHKGNIDEAQALAKKVIDACSLE